jgi:phosphotransferase system  glucose/maltose/N-acetylglucosamine-specific IIC component
MKLSVKGTAFAAALMCGILAMFLTGIANLIWPSYGQEFLRLMASVYPGYHGTPSFGQVIVGTLYGIVDGAVAGAIFAWLYNSCAKTQLPEAHPKQTP